jgi:hypothetical protein
VNTFVSFLILEKMLLVFPHLIHVAYMFVIYFTMLTYIPSFPNFFNFFLPWLDVEFFKSLHLFRWLWHFYPWFCICAMFCLLFCICWTMLAFLKWTQLDYVVWAFLMCCIWFASIEDFCSHVHQGNSSMLFLFFFFVVSLYDFGIRIMLAS